MLLRVGLKPRRSRRPAWSGLSTPVCWAAGHAHAAILARQRRGPPWAVSAWVSWLAGGPLTGRLCGNSDPLPRARDVQASTRIVAVTGSSGAGTSTVKTRLPSTSFDRERNSCRPVVEGDSYHRFERPPMKAEMAKAQEAGVNFSHFRPEANRPFDKLERSFVPHLRQNRNGREALPTCTALEESPPSTTARLAPAWNPGQFSPPGSSISQTPMWPVYEGLPVACGRGL